MSFFIPRELIDFTYLGGESSESDDEYDALARPYRDDLDFAFFVVNFGYSRSDYDQLTDNQKLFIVKAWEDKLVSDNMHIYNAVHTAIYNANRQKGDKYRVLWEKKNKGRGKVKRLVSEQESKEIEEAIKSNMSWVDLAYLSSGQKRPTKKG